MLYNGFKGLIYKIMCKCINIPMGSYKRQTSMKTPQGKWVCIDTCLVQEIAELWYKGIETIESCCGHNLVEGYIIVNKRYKSLMLSLGYIQNKEWSKYDDESVEGILFYSLTK